MLLAALKQTNEKVFVSKENLATVSKQKCAIKTDHDHRTTSPEKKKKPLDTSFQAPFTCLETFTLKTKARVKLRTSSHRPNLIKVWVDLQYKVRIAWVKRPNAIQPNFGGKKTSRDVWALARLIYVWKSYFELRSEASGSRSHRSQCHLRQKSKLNLNSEILISSRKRKVWMGFET